MRGLCSLFTLGATTSLHAHLRKAKSLSTVFGYGKLSEKKSRSCHIVYAVYQGVALFALALVLIRYLAVIKLHAPFDLKQAATVLAIIWAVQGLFSAIFFIYNWRSGRLEKLKEDWAEFCVDDLIKKTSFKQNAWRWLLPVLVFLIAILAHALAEVVMHFYDVYNINKAIHHSEILAHTGTMIVMIPCIIFSVVAWAVPLYTYYVICIHFNYAWMGFAKKILQFEKTEPFGESTLIFVSDTHNQLSKIMNQINKIYGPYVLVMISIAVFELFLHLYLMAHVPTNTMARVEITIWVLSSVVPVFIIFAACLVNLTAGSIPELFYDHYHESRHGDLSQRLLVETSILQTKLYNTRICFTASGLFDVSIAGLGAIISILATAYFIFLMDMPEVKVACNLVNDTLTASSSL